jgi:two-component system, NtrC family, sensor histidine kinase KinB
VIYRAIIQNKYKIKKISMTITHYRTLYEIAKSLHQQNLDIRRTLQTLLSKTADAVGVTNGCLITFKTPNEIDHVYILGASDTPENRNRELWNTLHKHGLVGYVYYSDRSVVLRNIQTDPRWPSLPDVDFLPKAGSAIGLPLGRGTDIFGVLLMVHPEVDYFTEKRLSMLDEIVRMASDALGNARELQLVRTGDTRYQAVFEHTPVPVILTDTTGTIEDANFKACEYLGFGRGVLQGIPIHDINIVTSEQFVTLSEDEEKFIRTSIYDIDGNEIPTVVRARRIHINERTYIEWVLQDVSVQMELEQLRLDLSAMVYHDLRGPLGSIHTVINKLSEVLHEHDNPLVLKLLKLGLRSSQQVSRLVESLLDIQRLEEGDAIHDKRPTELHVMMTDALQLVQPMAEEVGIHLELDVTKLPPALMDVNMVTRVVINLIENAVKYTPNGGQIWLSAKQIEDKVEVSVRDTGPGIPPEMAARIFNKFSRVKYKDVPKGIGLGLAFCRLAIEAHGGTIWVESDGKNGSDFKFTLPMEIKKDPKKSAKSAEGDDKAKSEFATSA